ncbi:MAG: threonylcarbamoyl-AMP synthase [Myxococcales bacterium]|nr:MAG: threonylcarbamoyl-AMP synthase [Myxococcales bacterium]
MGTIYDTSDPDQLEAGLEAAALALRNGELIVLPTDTVYGVGADAFEASSVAGLLAAKGRGREMPPPVLISAATTIDALAVGLPEWTRALVEEYWPGPLTLVCRQQPSLTWDLGETKGTVAVRMPDHPVALELLARVGPTAVSSANTTGQPAATTAAEAAAMLGESVAVILDGGPAGGQPASTILDCTGERPFVLREGALSSDELRTFLAGIGCELEVDQPGA